MIRGVNMKYTFLAFISICLLLSGCQTEMKPSNSNKKTELVISAAASLQDALKEIEASFHKQHPNVTLTNNFGSSGALKQQIAQGAKADLFSQQLRSPSMNLFNLETLIKIISRTPYKMS